MDLGLEKDLHIRETIPEATNVINNPRAKPAPILGEQTIPTPFSYLPSDDGTDENLLILIHGLGEFVFFSQVQSSYCPRYTKKCLIGVISCPRRHTCTVCEDGG